MSESPEAVVVVVKHLVSTVDNSFLGEVGDGVADQHRDDVFEVAVLVERSPPWSRALH